MGPRYLERLEIEAFRGISGLVLEDLAAVNIVVGANNTGKSSVLEAAAIAIAPQMRSTWVRVVRSRDLTIPLVDGIAAIFSSHPRLRFAITGTSDHKQVQVDGIAKVVRDEEEDDERGLFELIVRRDEFPNRKIVFGRGLVLLKQPEVTRFRFVDATTHRSLAQIVETLSATIDVGLKPSVLDILKLFDPRIDDLNIVSSGRYSNLRVTHKDRGVVDLSSFGDGMRRSVAMALMLARASDGLLLIDEIETGIHPTALVPVFTQLFAAAKQANVQILATTHSIEAVDALAEAAKDSTEIAAYRLHRRGGALKARRYEQERLKTIRKEGLDVR